MLVLAASVRRGGKSLAQIALTELGRPASLIVSLAILVIVVIALAGLGFVVVKALGGEEVKLPAGMTIKAPTAPIAKSAGDATILEFPERCEIRYAKDSPSLIRPERFQIKVPGNVTPTPDYQVPEGAKQLVPGSSWGTFTIACTIPIALFVGLWMYKIRKGHVVEASIIGGVGVLAATIAGSLIPGARVLEPYFSLSKEATILALCGYGFIASVLPVWMLLCPRDYISSFLKVGTIGLLIIGVLAANPALPCPPLNQTFADGGPTLAGSVFPFVFICVMCGAISGFHALVSSGTTPKMIDKESQVRMIGYGSMLMEGIVGIVALLAAASLPMDLYYDINVDLDKASKFQPALTELYKEYGLDQKAARDRLHHLAGRGQYRSSQYRRRGPGANRGAGRRRIAAGPDGRRGDACGRHGPHLYQGDALGRSSLGRHHEILVSLRHRNRGVVFILTTIDTGTRIARFLLQETIGKALPRFEKTDWLPGAVVSTLAITVGWGALVASGSIDTIWPMFGIANQLLAVLALCLVTTMLVNAGRGKYAPVTLLPMLFVTVTTMTAGVQMAQRFTNDMRAGNVAGVLNLGNDAVRDGVGRARSCCWRRAAGRGGDDGGVAGRNARMMNAACGVANGLAPGGRFLFGRYDRRRQRRRRRSAVASRRNRRSTRWTIIEPVAFWIDHGFSCGGAGNTGCLRAFCRDPQEPF